MNSLELQQLKMAWIAAREAGNTQTQVQLLHDYPEAQEALSDFIVAYAATSRADTEEIAATTALLPSNATCHADSMGPRLR